jgi:hypothetical protein
MARMPLWMTSGAQSPPFVRSTQAFKSLSTEVAFLRNYSGRPTMKRWRQRLYGLLNTVTPTRFGQPEHGKRGPCINTQMEVLEDILDLLLALERRTIATDLMVRDLSVRSGSVLPSNPSPL